MTALNVKYSFYRQSNDGDGFPSYVFNFLPADTIYQSSTFQVTGVASIRTPASPPDRFATFEDAQAYFTGNYPQTVIDIINGSFGSSFTLGSVITQDQDLANALAVDDDVLEYMNLASFPGTGENGKIYIADDTGKIYRWTGSIYINVAPLPSAMSSVATTALSAPVNAPTNYGALAAILGGDINSNNTKQNAIGTAVNTLDGRVTAIINGLKAQGLMS